MPGFEEAALQYIPIPPCLRQPLAKGANEAFGCEVFCLVADDEVKQESQATGETRSALAMRKAAPRLNGGIVAIGNAPTALHEAITLCEQGKAASRRLLCGLPVGFVEARESKERLWASGLVCITNLDRKGGTPATAAALNALFKIAQVTCSKLSVRGEFMTGKLYIIGVGPGDPGLLTVRALELLRKSHRVFIPVSGQGRESLALDIIQRAHIRRGQRNRA